MFDTVYMQLNFDFTLRLIGEFNRSTTLWSVSNTRGLALAADLQDAYCVRYNPI